ncbi:MAG: hypothetical protein Q4B59_01305 [Lachnospiraceae bacterium]|nr:hypothetical protein [Lachnospiraceae bacterium]
MKSKIRRGRFGWLMVLTLLLCLWIALPGQAAVKKTTSKNVIRMAKRNQISGGTWEKKNGKIYYRKAPTKKKPRGERIAGAWAMIDDNVYYFNAKGALVFGKFKYNGKQYMSDRETGEVYYGELVKIGKKTYGFRTDGVLAKKEWIWVDEDKYYCDAKGRVLTSCWIGKRYVGSNGAMVQGFSKKQVTKNASKAEVKKKQRLIVVGASRVCDMRDAVGTDRKFRYDGQEWNTVFICRRGAGFDWFRDIASAKLQAYLDIYPKSKVVIQLGNNDVSHVEDGRLGEYAALYRKLMRRYPKATFYFMDALPSMHEQANVRRQVYNRALRAAFPKQWIGGFDFLLALPFSPTEDGTHYQPSTSVAIFKYIRQKVGLMKPSSIIAQPEGLTGSQTGKPPVIVPEQTPETEGTPET